MLILIAASPCKLQYICSLTVTKDGWYRFRVGTNYNIFVHWLSQRMAGTDLELVLSFFPPAMSLCAHLLWSPKAVSVVHTQSEFRWMNYWELVSIFILFLQKMKLPSRKCKCITIRLPDGQLFRKLEDLEGSRRNTSQIGFHFLYTTELCSFVYTITNPKGNSTLIQFIV